MGSDRTGKKLSRFKSPPLFFALVSTEPSIAAKSRWPQWQEQGLYLFQLPKYSSQMNPIESEWHQLKTHELIERMFEDEYEERDRGY